MSNVLCCKKNKCFRATTWPSFIVGLLMLLTLARYDIEAQKLRPPASDFKRHKLVQPTIHHGRTKREISSTRDTNGIHHPEVKMTLNIDGEDHILDLRLNQDLITDNHILSYQKDGKTILHKPKLEELDICQYGGTVRDKPGSWVAVSTCHGVNGIIYDGDQMRYIHPAEGNDIKSQHYLYTHEDLNTEFHCGYVGGVTNRSSFDPLLFMEHHKEKERKKSRVRRYKRSASEDTLVRSPYNANKLSRYVELVLVVDNSEFVNHGRNLKVVYHQMKDVANIINSVYTPLNIFIALVGVVVWTERDEIDLEEDGDRTLNKFLAYRKSTLCTTIPNDNAQLLTHQKFKDGVVGKGLKGPICTYEYSGAVSNNHSSVIGLVAVTMAHEMGHNFGMEHDTLEDCKCPDEKCIMSPSSTSVVPKHWSSCSMQSLALAFKQGMDYCLRNKPKTLFDSPTCGNGFVEAGEQCDCGLVNDGQHADCQRCCHPNTCRLRSNATCAAGPCCDLQTCRTKAPGTECRSATQECDLPEYCTGHSEYCPENVFKMDTTPCGNEKEAYCVQGTCRSRTDQCRLLWGVTGSNSDDKCYARNLDATKHGNCGYDRIRQIYLPCRPEHTMCGMLQCRHLNERLEFGMESVSFLSQMFINNAGSITPCRTVIIDLGLGDVDPGLVPDGAKCGENKMCLKQRCLPVEEVRKSIIKMDSSICPSNCSGNGVCNSLGHCHCDEGFAPPICMMPGPGGSIDSGPAINPNVQKNFMIAMYVIFLGIIPSIMLFMFLVYYYSRHNMLLWWKKPKKSLQSMKKASLPRRLSLSATKFASSFQNNSQNNPQPVNVHTLSNPDDMSSSLLRSDSDHSPAGNINPSVNFFGNFKGFSLTPMEKNTPTTKQDTQSVEEVNNISKPNVKHVSETVSVTKSAKITPVHRSGSNSQSLANQSVLKPIMRAAPPLPVVPTAMSPTTSPSIKRTNSSVQSRIKAIMSSDKTEELPVTIPNTGPPRPVISSPILEASTCTAKELISPLQGSKTLGPARTAPNVPIATSDIHKRPLSMHSAGSVLQKPLPEEPKKVKEGISLNRIASFLKQDKPKEKERNPVERSHSLPKNPSHQIKVSKAVDKVALRNLQISNPILQKEIDLPVNTVPVVSDSEDVEEPKAFINRAQSMRAPMIQKSMLQSFASMRQPSTAPRPVSGVGRPTAPPPPLPNPSNNDMPQTSFLNSKPVNEIKSTDYVDCIEEKPVPLAHIEEDSTENIYTIIEESPIKSSKPLPAIPQPTKTAPQPPPEGYIAPKAITTNSGSTESVGLLGEIVNEIQTRNFDSIYSASTLSRKKKGREKIENTDEATNRDSTYMNTDHYKTPESIYSNSGAKSTISTTSSGYLHPSAVNVPTYLNKSNTNQEGKQENDVPSSPNLKGTNSKIPTFARQVTPPTLKPNTTFKSVPQSPKNTIKNSSISSKELSNSPDLVSSCSIADTKNIKAPDVINNNKMNNETPRVAVKPNVTAKPLRPAPAVDKKPVVKISPTLKPVNSINNTNNKTQVEKPLNSSRNGAKVENVKTIADNLNKNKPKFQSKPIGGPAQKPDTTTKPNPTKLSAKPSNVASLQQKFENRKSLGKDPGIVKK